MSKLWRIRFLLPYVILLNLYISATMHGKYVGSNAAIIWWASGFFGSIFIVLAMLSIKCSQCSRNIYADWFLFRLKFSPLQALGMFFLGKCRNCGKLNLN